MVETIFDRPMFSDQGEETSGRSLLHRETAQSVHDFMAKLARFEQERRAFQPKDLLNSLPLLAEPVIEVRTTGDLPMLQPSMGFVPGFCLQPSSPIWGAVLKQVGDIFMQGWLIVAFQSGHNRRPADGFVRTCPAAYASHPGSRYAL